MTNPNLPYVFDITGTLPANLITNELHTLTNLDSEHTVRVLIPLYGAFFANSLIIKDVTNNTVLNNTQYILTEYFDTVSLKIGLDVYGVILITDQNVSNNIEITYQLVGGYLQINLNGMYNNYYVVANIVSSLNLISLLNKPFNYPPAIHDEILDDLGWFQPIVAMLEKMYSAMLLSDVPIFEAIKDYVASKQAVIPQFSTTSDIDNVVSNNDVVTMNTLLYASQNLNFNVFKLTSLVSNLEANNSNTYILFGSNISDNYTCYWSIEHLTTTNLDFLVTSGELTIVNKTATFNINALNPLSSTPYPKKFRILINKTTNPNSTLFTSGILNIIGGLFTSLSIGTQILKIINARYFGNPTIPRNALSASITSVIGYPDNFQ